MAQAGYGAPAGDRAASLSRALAEPETAGQTAVYSLLGHKGDLMLVHFRESFQQLNAAECS